MFGIIDRADDIDLIDAASLSLACRPPKSGIEGLLGGRLSLGGGGGMDPCGSSLNINPGFELGGLINDELPVFRRYVDGPATGEGPAETWAYGVE